MYVNCHFDISPGEQRPRLLCRLCLCLTQLHSSEPQAPNPQQDGAVRTIRERNKRAACYYNFSNTKVRKQKEKFY